MLTVSTKVSRPRVQFTPAGYKRARRAYDQGSYGELIAMMKEAAVDSHVAGCLIGRRAGFKRPWTLTSQEDTDTDTQRRDWMHAVLQDLDVYELLEAIHEARLYLYKVVDFDWQVVDGRQVPVAFEAFEQHFFRYDDKDRRLKIDQGNRLEEIPDTALVVEYKKQPVMLPVLRDYILKEFGLESFAGFMETFGEPFILARYPPGATTEQKREIDEGLRTMAASSRGKVPQGTEIEIRESARSSGDHDKFLDRCDKGISISLLGHAQAVEQSRGLQIGDHPTGFEVRREISVDDCRLVEPVVNRLIRTVWRRNFSDDRYPLFELDKSEPVNPSQFTAMVKTWFDMGLVIHPDMARKVGLYVVEDQEPMQRTTPNLFD